MKISKPVWRGPRGQGIENITYVFSTRMLRVTYTGGGTQDVGPLPVGEGGAVTLSSDAGQLLELRDDGLYAPGNLLSTNW